VSITRASRGPLPPEVPFWVSAILAAIRRATSDAGGPPLLHRAALPERSAVDAGPRGRPGRYLTAPGGQQLTRGHQKFAYSRLANTATYYVCAASDYIAIPTTGKLQMSLLVR